ncbi:uncharacterized protein LOC122644821 [Telopea speciosissima]|uniref:uncharacterized protein LOC122644821 n=1 Tax=Telopea speciosissima TaxID=54955 RepID=UPI001CC7673D|nr:uncharacterized protein LOC122644821 [Telopea speciosissima]
MEYNQKGEEERRKENPIVPVLSVRRSARLSEKRLCESIQKKDSRRIEAVQIAVLSEEEPEDLEKEKSIEGSEISVSKENEVTEPVVSGEIFINDNRNTDTRHTEESSVVNSSDTNSQDGEEVDGSVSEPVISGEIFIINNKTESCNTEKGCVVDSRDTNPLNVEEADQSVTGDVVSDTEPVSAEFQESGSLTTEEEKELHGLSEPVSMEDQDGADALVPESLSPEKICYSESKESIAETSLRKASNISPNKESIVGDLIGNEKQGMDKCKVDEDSEDDDDEDPMFVLQNMETKESDEGLAEDESGEVPDEFVSELEDISSLTLEKTSELQSLETRCLGLCPTEKPEMVDEGVELKNNTDKLAGEEPVSQSEVEDFVSDQVQKCDLVLEMNNGTCLFPCDSDDILLGMLNCVTDQLEKCDAVPELENAAKPLLTEALVDEKCSGKESSPIDETEVGDCVAALKAGNVDSSTCSDGVEQKLAGQDAVADDNSIDGFGTCDHHVARPDTQINEGSDLVENFMDSSSSTEGGEEFESSEASVFNTVELFSGLVLTDFHSENRNSAISASEKCDQTNVPGTVVAGQDAAASSVCSEGEEVFNGQSPTLLSSIAAHVTGEDDTATAAIDVIYEIPMPNEENKSGNDDNITSVLHVKDKISLQSSAINPITTPTKSLKNQTPGKSASKRQMPIRITVFGDNKENNQNVASSHKEHEDMSKIKLASSQKEYQDMSMIKMIKLIKEKEQQLENKRTALQSLKEN